MAGFVRLKDSQRLGELNSRQLHLAVRAAPGSAWPNGGLDIFHNPSLSSASRGGGVRSDEDDWVASLAGMVTVSWLSEGAPAMDSLTLDDKTTVAALKLKVMDTLQRTHPSRKLTAAGTPSKLPQSPHPTLSSAASFPGQQSMSSEAAGGGQPDNAPSSFANGELGVAGSGSVASQPLAAPPAAPPAVPPATTHVGSTQRLVLGTRIGSVNGGGGSSGSGGGAGAGSEDGSGDSRGHVAAAGGGGGGGVGGGLGLDWMSPTHRGDSPALPSMDPNPLVRDPAGHSSHNAAGLHAHRSSAGSAARGHSSCEHMHRDPLSSL